MITCPPKAWCGRIEWWTRICAPDIPPHLGQSCMVLHEEIRIRSLGHWSCKGCARSCPRFNFLVAQKHSWHWKTKSPSHLLHSLPYAQKCFLNTVETVCVSSVNILRYPVLSHPKSPRKCPRWSFHHYFADFSWLKTSNPNPGMVHGRNHKNKLSKAVYQLKGNSISQI